MVSGLLTGTFWDRSLSFFPVTQGVPPGSGILEAICRPFGLGFRFPFWGPFPKGGLSGFQLPFFWGMGVPGRVQGFLPIIPPFWGGGGLKIWCPLWI